MDKGAIVYYREAGGGGILQVVSHESVPQLFGSQGRAGNFLTWPGIEPGTSRMISEHSTTELLPHPALV